MLCQGAKIAQYVRDIETLPNFIDLSLAEKGGSKYTSPVQGKAARRRLRPFSLPPAKGGGFCAAKLGGIVVYTFDLLILQNDRKDNPSVAPRQLPLHKGAFFFFCMLRDSSLWSHAVDPHMGAFSKVFAMR